MVKNLAGKTALVTGGSRGLVRRFASRPSAAVPLPAIYARCAAYVPGGM